MPHLKNFLCDPGLLNRYLNPQKERQNQSFSQFLKSCHKNQIAVKAASATLKTNFKGLEPLRKLNNTGLFSPQELCLIIEEDPMDQKKQLQKMLNFQRNPWLKELLIQLAPSQYEVLRNLYFSPGLKKLSIEFLCLENSNYKPSLILDKKKKPWDLDLFSLFQSYQWPPNLDVDTINILLSELNKKTGGSTEFSLTIPVKPLLKPQEIGMIWNACVSILSVVLGGLVMPA